MVKKILVIDDEEELLGMIKLRLEANHYEVVTADNGVTGLEQWKKEQPDLIVLDVMMPEMDGFTFIQEAKTRKELNDALIIVLTAKAQVEDIFKMEGVKDYILKPFNDSDLLATIKKNLDGVRNEVV